LGEQFLLFKNRRQLIIVSVIAIAVPPFYPGHGPEILFLTGFIGKPGISPGFFNTLVPHQYLEALQAHPGIEKLGGKSMPKGMDRIALMSNAGFFKIVHDPGATSAVTHHASLTASIKQIFIPWIPIFTPCG
jgi:hypothetical protein